MKIRSHTGNMVEARVGMVVKYLNSTHNFTIVGFCDNRVQLDDQPLIADHPDALTMLFCPFAVGDEVEIYSDRNKVWIKTTWGIFDQDMVIDYGEDYADGFRHASPDLRPAEGYDINQRARAQG